MIEIGTATFSGVHGAEHAFADARDHDPAAAWMDETAFAEVHKSGRVVVRGNVAGHYVDVDGSGDAMGRETGNGVIVGAVIGLPLGPLGLAEGVAAGLTVGGVVQTHQVPKLGSEFFDAIRERLPQGSSAIVVCSDGDRIQDMFEALRGTDATFAHHRLAGEAEAELRSALSQTVDAQPPGASAA